MISQYELKRAEANLQAHDDYALNLPPQNPDSWLYMQFYNSWKNDVSMVRHPAQCIELTDENLSWCV